MKPSGIEWIGDIPDDWEVRKLLSLFKEHKDRNKNLREQNLLSLSYGKIKRKDINNNDGLLPASFETYNIVENGDIVFRLTDLQNDKRSLRTGIVTQRGIITSAYVTIRPKIRLDSRFFHYLYHMYDICKVFYGMGDGVRQGMGFEDLKNIPTLIPPLKTQQKIADYLDKKCGEIDATIAKQKESIEKLKAYKQSLISETVTKGLDKSASLKPSGIDYLGDIPSHWEIKKLKFVANFNQNTLPEDTDGQFELKYIDIGNVSSVDGIKEIQYFNFSNAPSRARRIVKYGDIIVSTVRTYLRAITSIKEDYDNCICSTGFAVITPKDNVQQDFVVYAIENESFIAQIIANSQGISYPAINVSQLENLKLAFPSIKKQKEIVDFLKIKLLEIDSTINKKQNIIQKLDAYKKSLIFECVTGKHKIY